MALPRNSTDTYGGAVFVGAPAIPQPPRRVPRDTRLAYEAPRPDDWEPARALDECHKKIVEIYALREGLDHSHASDRGSR